MLGSRASCLENSVEEIRATGSGWGWGRPRRRSCTPDGVDTFVGCMWRLATNFGGQRSRVSCYCEGKLCSFAPLWRTNCSWLWLRRRPACGRWYVLGWFPSAWQDGVWQGSDAWWLPLPQHDPPRQPRHTSCASPLASTERRPTSPALPPPAMVASTERRPKCGASPSLLPPPT